MGGPRRAGLVLAGGRSSRFGGEKAVAVLEGRPLLAWSLSALQTCCAAVAVSAAAGSGAEAWARSAGIPVLHDDPGHARGPLAGLAAGLGWAAGEGFNTLATLPCDTPGVGLTHLGPLFEAAVGAPAAFAETADGPHPLCAVWRVSLLPLIAVRLAGGEHPSVRGLLSELGAVSVRFADPSPFRNMNRLADLEGPGGTGA